MEDLFKTLGNALNPKKSSIPEFNSPKNWNEDFHLENGNYICHCIKCDDNFFGHKRRNICKECDTKLTTPSGAKQ